MLGVWDKHLPWRENVVNQCLEFKDKHPLWRKCGNVPNTFGGNDKHLLWKKGVVNQCLEFGTRTCSSSCSVAASMHSMMFMRSLYGEFAGHGKLGLLTICSKNAADVRMEAVLLELRTFFLVLLELRISIVPLPVGAKDGRCPVGAKDGRCPVGAKDWRCPVLTKDGRCPTEAKDWHCPVGTMDGRCPVGAKDWRCPVGAKDWHCPEGAKDGRCPAGAKDWLCPTGANDWRCPVGARDWRCPVGAKDGRCPGPSAVLLELERACVRVCVVSVIVKRPVLPPSVVDGRSRNPLYYYYYCPRLAEYSSGFPCSSFVFSGKASGLY